MSAGPNQQHLHAHSLSSEIVCPIPIHMCTVVLPSSQEEGRKSE